MHKIGIDTPQELVEVTLGGMMSVADVEEYIGDLKRAFVRHGLRSYALIIDVRACPVQSQDMIRAMAMHMAAMPKARAIAVVVGSSLAKMQVRRLFTQHYARVVQEPEAGRAWVLRGEEPAATPPVPIKAAS